MKYRIVKVFDADDCKFWWKCQYKKIFWHTIRLSCSEGRAMKFMLDYIQGKKTVWEEKIK